jgi:hypothetical protein
MSTRRIKLRHRVIAVAILLIVAILELGQPRVEKLQASPAEENERLIRELRDVTEVDLTCTHMGWGSKTGKLTIVKASDGFTANGKKVADNHMEEFLDAVASPAIAELSLVNLGITPEWVEANASAILEGIEAAKYGKFVGNCSERQKDFFNDHVKTPSTIEKAVQDYYLRTFWTGDYPQITVEISFTAGRSIRLTSSAQQQFMIPWSIERNEMSSVTYNADISRALSTLMPVDFLHRERLDGNLVKMLTDRLSSSTADLGRSIQKMMLSETLGDEYSEFIDQHEIGFSHISTLTSVDAEGIHPTVWYATIRRKKLSEQVKFELELPIQRGLLPDLSSFLKEADGLAARVLGVPWLRDYLEEHPNAAVQIEISDNEFSWEGWIDFLSKRLKENQQNDLMQLRNLEPADPITIVVREGRERSSKWWVLSEKRMVMVRFAGDRALSWRAEQFGHEPTIRGRFSYVGVLVGPNGELHDGDGLREEGNP